jgi:hypothetical protein
LLTLTIFLSSVLYAGPNKKEFGKLGPSLQRLVREYETRGVIMTGRMAQAHGYNIRAVDGETLFPVILEPLEGKGSSDINTDAIAAMGFTVDAVSRSYVRVLAPANRLRLLGDLPDISVARAPKPKTEIYSGYGSIMSESVILTNAINPQLAGYGGAGSKVAVVDLGFQNLTNAQSAGEIPMSAVRVKGDVEGASIELYTPHGTGVAEHVMDMAPAAQLYCILIEDLVDLQNAADYIRDNGIHVANHSVGWVNSSYYDDTGPISTIINDSHDNDGIFWAVSAGNAANRHWRGEWNDPEGNDTLNFAGSDELMIIAGSASSTTVSFFVNWNQYGNPQTDLDLYIIDKDSVVVATSTAPQPGWNPEEGVSFIRDPERAPYNAIITLYSGPTVDLDITIFSFRHNLEYAVKGSSLMEPAECHGAFTVGAIYQGDYSDPVPPPESFSSHGPTNDGRQKPDIAAPDGTQSLTYGASFGTSFSSPTTAGAAALMREIVPGLDANGLADTLRAMAIDVTPAGPDSIYGWGKLYIAFGSDSIPVITSITDVPDDQGLEVNLDWAGSSYDAAGSPKPVVAYDIFRRSMSMTWDSIMTVAATGASDYQVIAPTEKDSTITGGMYYSAFRVRARTASEYYESPPDSGYSVDNLVPPAPTGFIVAYNEPGGTELGWESSADEDVTEYRIYRDTTGTFTPGPGNLVHSTPDTFWTDTVADGYEYSYQVSAVDDAGNEGDPSPPETTTGADEMPDPKVLTLYQNFPNPFNPVTAIRFDLPSRSRVKLAVYNVNGQLVRVLVDDIMNPGSKSVTWNGLDSARRPAASGVYFYHLIAKGRVKSRKMILLR